MSQTFKHPARVKGHDRSVEYVFDTPKATVYALRYFDRDTWEVTINTKGDDGLTEEDVDRLVDALMEVD